MRTEGYPYIGIIYNWKGLKEENYIYTIEEMAEFDPVVLDQCLMEQDEWHNGGFCANKTYNAVCLHDEESLRSFLLGESNDSIDDMLDSNQDRNPEDYSDWYWANQLNNDLYGHRSNTLKKIVNKLGIPKEYCQ